MIGEIVEVAANEEIPLTPSQIIAIADAALKDPTLTQDLALAFAKVVVNKPKGNVQ